MSLFRYRVWFDSDNGQQEAERTFLARTEGEAFRQVEAAYPTWYSAELVHEMRVGRG
jgi:hypothetical protein